MYILSFFVTLDVDQPFNSKTAVGCFCAAPVLYVAVSLPFVIIVAAAVQTSLYK